MQHGPPFFLKVGVQFCSLTLSYIDALASGIFPETLMGIYQLETCIGPMIHEEVIVKNCQGYNHSFVCRIEIHKPEALEQQSN